MIVLALDTCLAACSVAVLKDGHRLAAASEPMTRGHQERLALMVAEVMAAAGVEFAAIDGRPTHLFFVLFAPENSAGIHLKALARISRLFKVAPFRQAILLAPPAAPAVFKLIADEDAKY